MKESVRVERLLFKLFAKLLPITEYHVYTSYGVSLNYYRGANEKLVGTG